ncbi:hypothetical protein phytr_12210 [Candidatus Phycorickettsia trachydisci]|uniref:Uncharacterized protein n=1 Tax=Candidatus Phycorickettsia trachydisci TaxID=2115978 RepID=A0A2P1PA78_9RICK|nr:hypothetical protein [Candidatus Phycorickettsia trachydisci]AVP88146.1 hypothetical protein phytr_12210 [Candidatus Phycorickettsia trachydisci]
MKYADLKDFSLILNEEVLDKHLQERSKAEVEVMYKRYLDSIKFFMIKHNLIVSGKLNPKSSMIPDDINMLESWIKNGVIKIIYNSNLHDACNPKCEDLKKIRLNFSETDLKQYVEHSIHTEGKKYKNLIKFIVKKHNDMVKSSISRSELQDKEILEFLIKKGCVELDTKQVNSDDFIEINSNTYMYPITSTKELGEASSDSKIFDDI